MSDYDHYLAALAGGNPPVHANDPKCGYYKRNFERGGPFVAAAIWRGPDGNLLCRVGADMVDPRQAWVRLARHPVPETSARHWFETGAWPGEDVAAVAAAAPEQLAPVEPVTGGDTAFTSDGEPRLNEKAISHYTRLIERVEDALAASKDWTKPDAKIADETQATIVGNKVGILRELIGELEKTHEVEKAPHLKAGREVDERYLPFVKKLKPLVERLRALSTVWLNAKDEERRKAEEAARAATEQAKVSGEEVPFDFPAPVHAPVRMGGDTGRALHLKTKTEVEISDAAKVFKVFKDHPDVLAVLSKLAFAELKAGKKVPGAKIVETKVAA